VTDKKFKVSNCNFNNVTPIKYKNFVKKILRYLHTISVYVNLNIVILNAVDFSMFLCVVGYFTGPPGSVGQPGAGPSSPGGQPGIKLESYRIQSKFI